MYVMQQMQAHFVKEGFCEDSVVVAGGEVTGVEWVTELARVVAGYLSPVLPEGQLFFSKTTNKMSNLPVCVTHIAKRSLGLGNVETAPPLLFCKAAIAQFFIIQAHLHPRRPSPLE